MKKANLDKTLLAFQYLALTMLAGLLLLEVFNSLDWRMAHDSAIYHYSAFLMDKHGFIPYRDIFDANMPGTFAFHYFVGKLFGYGDIAWRFVDLVVLAAVFAVTYVFMSRFGRLAAIWAVVLFGLVYLSKGQIMTLQRDYIGLVPVMFSLLCLPVKTNTSVKLFRFALVGLLFGMSVLVKPHLGMTLPVVFGTLLAFRWASRSRSVVDFLTCGAVCSVSFLAPVIAAIFWLAANSALVPFTSMLLEYHPLYMGMTGSHEHISEPDRAFYLLESTLKLGGYVALFMCSLFAYYRMSTHAGHDKATIMSFTCLLFCTLLYAVYPTLAGKFWDYHYIPFAYFCALSAGLCLFAWPKLPNGPLVWQLRETLPLLTLLIAVTVQLNLPRHVLSSYNSIHSKPEVYAPVGGRVDEIASWLRARLHPGDSVQPLDWVGGSIHAMLLADAKLATRFIYDVQFYHHVSSPYVQWLRASFIDQLRKASPRFVIEVYQFKPWVRGIDTTRSFPELREFLGADYTVAFEGKGYRIYERMTGAQSGPLISGGLW